MKLHISFDDDLMRQYHRRGASPLFTIYWMHGQEAFPGAGWVDFGAVILSWWLVAAKSLLSGSRQESLSFMDGPYELSVRPLGDLFYVSTMDSSEPWKVAQTAFVNELLSAANETTAKLSELGIPDSEGLQVGVRALKTALAEREGRTRTQQTAKQFVHP